MCGSFTETQPAKRYDVVIPDVGSQYEADNIASALRTLTDLSVDVVAKDQD